MQYTVVEADVVVGDEDDDAGGKGMVDKDLEGSKTSSDQEGSCWTPTLS
jgi:hypothetical protein